MSDETKDTNNAQAAEQPHENPQPETTEAKSPKGKSETKAKAKAKAEPAAGASALKAVGTAACNRHGLAQVWVTSDGQCFPQEGDAKEHTRNLSSKEIIKVTAK